MKRLLKVIVVMTIVSAGMWGLGLALARRFEAGAGFADADEFRIAAYWGGREFSSTTSNLISGKAKAVLGGISLDLRDAKLGPEGADLALEATLGGVAMTVPADWRIVITSDVRSGGIDVKAADPADLPADAPELRITATVRSGGIAISASDPQ